MGIWTRSDRTARPVGRLGAGAIILVALALLPAPGSALAAKKHPASADWQPAPERMADPRLRLEDGRWTFSSPDLEMQVELLDASRRTVFLKSAGISTSDPFHEDNTSIRLFTFLVRMENVGGRDLLLRPQSIFFITRKPMGQATPCDFSCLVAGSAAAGLSERESQSLLKACLDPSETLQPGQRLSKLLVFNRMPQEFRDFVLDFDGLSAGGDTIRVVLPYAVPKPDEKAGKADSGNGTAGSGR